MTSVTLRVRALPITMVTSMLVAACDASDSSCHSALQPPRRQNLANAQGCDCVQTPANSHSYCTQDFIAVGCHGAGRWSFGQDGPCQFAEYTSGSCARLNGTLIDGGTCPSGFATHTSGSSGTIDAGLLELGRCCYPVDVTSQNCTQAGFLVTASEQQDQSLSTRCANGGALRGFVVEEGAIGLCCDPL